MIKRTIQQRKRIFIAAEGESEQSFVKWLQQLSDQQGMIEGCFLNFIQLILQEMKIRKNFVSGF